MKLNRRDTSNWNRNDGFDRIETAVDECSHLGKIYKQIEILSFYELANVVNNIELIQYNIFELDWIISFLKKNYNLIYKTRMENVNEYRN